MINKKKFLNTPMGKALLELSDVMNKSDIAPISINVIGGFALILRELRSPSAITDIDYVGESLSNELDRLIDRIGIKYNLGTGWINNDVMLSGITFEDFEYITGPLNFEEAFSVGNITINVLEEEDLLRMKLISLDTSLTAIEVGGDFSRAKDLNDIVVLMNHLKLSQRDVSGMYQDYLINPITPKIIKMLSKVGERRALDFIDKIVEINQAKNGNLISKIVNEEHDR